MPRKNATCPCCGETGPVKRMDIKGGACHYCRRDSLRRSILTTELDEADRLRAKLLAALEASVAELESARLSNETGYTIDVKETVIAQGHAAIEEANK